MSKLHVIASEAKQSPFAEFLSRSASADNLKRSLVALLLGINSTIQLMFTSFHKLWSHLRKRF